MTRMKFDFWVLQNHDKDIWNLEYIYLLYDVYILNAKVLFLMENFYFKCFLCFYLDLIGCNGTLKCYNCLELNISYLME